MPKEHPIHRSKPQIIFAFIAVACLLGLSGYGAYVKGTQSAESTILIGITVVLAAAWLKTIYLLTTFGKPLAVVNATGIVLPSGELFRWDDIRELTLNSIGTVVDVRTDLNIVSEKSRKKLTYVALNEKKLNALLAAVRP